MIDTRPGAEFSYEGALNKLVNLQSLTTTGTEFLVPGEAMTYDEILDPDDLGLTRRQGKLLQISAWLDLECRVSIGCVGAIIAQLQRKRAAEYLQDDPDARLAYRITNIEMFSLKGTMYVFQASMLHVTYYNIQAH